MPSAVSQHAIQRLDERVGISRRAAARMAARAHDEGITRSETSGDLHRWLQATEGNGTVYARIHGQHVYLFGNGTKLVTVIHLPREYHKAASKIRRSNFSACQSKFTPN